MLNLNARELGTVLAALRYMQNDMTADTEWQHGDIATNCGEFLGMEADEIDGLCERLNSGKTVPAEKLSACCKAPIHYDAWVNSNDECVASFDHCICSTCGEEKPQVATIKGED